MVNKCKNKGSVLVVLGQIQIKSPVRLQVTPLGWLKWKRPTISSVDKEEMQKEQPLWKTARQFLTRSNTHSLVIPPLGIFYPREMETYVHTRMCTLSSNRLLHSQNMDQSHRYDAEQNEPDVNDCIKYDYIYTKFQEE